MAANRSSIHPLSPRAHSLLDFFLIVLTAVGPYLFGFSNIAAARNLMFAVAASCLVYVLLTETPISLFRWLPFGIHRALDVAAGFFIATGPQTFDYGYRLSGGQLFYHFALGAAFAAIAVYTHTMTAGELGDRLEEEEEETGRAA